MEWLILKSENFFLPDVLPKVQGQSCQMRNFSTFTEPNLWLTNFMPWPGLASGHWGVETHRLCKGKDLRKAGGGKIRWQDDLSIKNK